jgi:hypothetical protein
MNCRTFHRKLEDYLEDGLDFPGRFGIERHAQQCIGCGKMIADAQRLGQMARELKRVHAPLNFEASILKDIANRKLNSRFGRFRGLWTYRFEFPSGRKLALSSVAMAVLLLGGFYAFNHPTIRLSRQPLPSASHTAAPIISAPFKTVENPSIADRNLRAEKGEPSARMPETATRTVQRQPIDIAQDEILDDLQETEYLEYLFYGPDNRPVTVRLPLPREVQMQSHGRPSQTYFIRNVSH